MPLPTAPHLYPRRVLVGVTGLSPQVITETVFALAVRPAPETPHFIPTEVHLITTQQGGRQAVLNLLSETPGWFNRLRADYQLPPIRFDADCIHVMHDANGTPLEDIRSPADNEHAADCITRLMRELTADPDCALHVSIAGGRKTMGFYLGYALSLFARPQDRLSHVLVSAPYESHPEFFYPTPYQHILQTRGDRPLALDAAQAEVHLAEIPFVSLRHGLQGLIEGVSDFRGTVAAARRALEPAVLEIDCDRLVISASTQEIQLSPTEFALIAVFARLAKEGQLGLRAPFKHQADFEWSQEFLSLLRETCGEWNIGLGLEDRLSQGVDGNWFSEHRSRLHRKLDRLLGPAAAPYKIQKSGRRPSRYQIDVAGSSIRITPGRTKPAPRSN